MQEYDIQTNNTMVISTLTTVSPMTKRQTETTIQGMKIIKHFPATSSFDASTDEIKDILLDLFKQNILFTVKENTHE